jgi:hypothetical protein
MTSLLLYPRRWRVGIDHGPSWAPGFWAVRLGPFELVRWASLPRRYATPEQRLARRMHRAGQAFAVLCLTFVLVGALLLMTRTI